MKEDDDDDIEEIDIYQTSTGHTAISLECDADDDTSQLETERESKENNKTTEPKTNKRGPRF
jgi:hypothetical protein